MTDENVVSPWQKHFNKQIGRGWVDLVNPYEDDDFGYDDEPDYHIRMKMIENEILRLCSFTKKEIHEWYWSMNNILLHNLYNFKKSITIDAQERYKMIEDKWKNI